MNDAEHESHHGKKEAPAKSAPVMGQCPGTSRSVEGTQGIREWAPERYKGKATKKKGVHIARDRWKQTKINFGDQDRNYDGGYKDNRPPSTENPGNDLW